MSKRGALPRYIIPPPTTFILSKSGVTYGTQPLQNKHWNKVRDKVQHKEFQAQGEVDAGNRNYGIDGPRWPQAKIEMRRPPSNNYERKSRQNGAQIENGRKVSQSEKRLPVNEEQEDKRVEQFHYASPDIFDDVDRIYDGRGNDKSDKSRTSDCSEIDDKISAEGRKNNYDGDVDWQKKNENSKLKKKKRANSVYDPETTKYRANKIDEEVSRDSREENRDMGMRNGGRNQLAHNEVDKERDIYHDVGEEHGTEDEEEANDVNEKRKKEKKTNKLADLMKKCKPKFAEKLLDAIEKHKSDCSIHFDEICKKYKKKNGEPVFTSYCCENGDTKESFKDSIKKKICNLAGGFYTRACDGIESFKDAAEDWLDEVKPNEDTTWSKVEGESGIRCIAHYDNRIEDNTIYVCSCCFNEAIDKDAHVSIKYFDSKYGCCKPKIVSRSFENRPYFCEKLLQSMPKKRRECFLKCYGKKHQMKGGVHCISRIPSMEEEFLSEKSTVEDCNGIEIEQEGQTKNQND